MFLQLGKVLPTLASPLFISLGLIIAAIFLAARRRVARMLSIAGILVLLVFSSPFVAAALLLSLEDQYPDVPIEAVPEAQAIVVLGGSIHAPSQHHNRTGLLSPSDRILHAFRLYRAGKAPVIVISGGNWHGGTPEARYMADLLAEWGVPPDALLLEGRSRNTQENAAFSRQMLQARGISRVLLVTSATHMPRAAALFRKAGFTVIPAPADYLTGWGAWDTSSIWSALVPSASALEASDRALREWLGLMVCRLTGSC